MKYFFSLLFAAFLFTACSAEAVNKQISLKAGESMSVTGGGSLSCGLNISAGIEGASWDMEGAESIRLKLELSSGEEYTAVLYGGTVTTLYEYNLAFVEEGTELIITYDPLLSRTADAVLNVESAEIICSDNPDLALYRKMCPLIQNRADVDFNDVPLMFIGQIISYYEDRPETPSEIKYTLVYSNEDGGSGAVPQYIWDGNGRLADIQSLFWIKDPETGSPSMVYDGAVPELHTKTPFEGSFVYGRPVLRITTLNGLADDDMDDGAPLLSPGIIKWNHETEWFTREQVMVYISGAYRVMAQEAFREGVAVENEAPSGSMSLGDLRNYLIIHYGTEEAGVFRAFDSEGQVLGESRTLTPAPEEILAGGLPVWIDRPAGEDELYLYFSGPAPQWQAVGYRADILKDVRVSMSCLSGSIDNPENPCRIW